MDEKNIAIYQRLQWENRMILQKVKCPSNIQISQYNKEISKWE